MSAIIAGIVRHGLTVLGGGLLTQGVINSGDIETITGAIVTIIGVVWSIWKNKQKKIK